MYPLQLLQICDISFIQTVHNTTFYKATKHIEIDGNFVC